MVLFSDIAKQVIAKDRAPERVNVFEIMAKPVIDVRPEMSIRHCARLFERFGISHAPVLKDDQVIGIISLLPVGARRIGSGLSVIGMTAFGQKRTFANSSSTSSQLASTAPRGAWTRPLSRS